MFEPSSLWPQIPPASCCTWYGHCHSSAPCLPTLACGRSPRSRDGRRNRRRDRRDICRPMQTDWCRPLHQRKIIRGVEGSGSVDIEVRLVPGRVRRADGDAK